MIAAIGDLRKRTRVGFQMMIDDAVARLVVYLVVVVGLMRRRRVVLASRHSHGSRDSGFDHGVGFRP